MDRVLLILLLVCCAYAQLLRPDVMNLGTYNPETKKFEKPAKPYLGNDHDDKPHKKPYLGGDDHDLKPHTTHLLGTGDHDYKQHGKHLLGTGDHDYKQHGKHLLGSGDHDYKPHGKKLLGSGDHDYKPHTKHLLGRGDHDYRQHGKVQRKNVYKKHTIKKQLLGMDNHDFGHMGAFKTFMKTFNRTYTDKKEFKKRFSIFRDNMQKVHVLQQSERGTAKYGATKFADWTKDEFRRLLGFRPELRTSNRWTPPAVIPDIDIPVEFDWRSRNVVTPVKNQGMCGSCWAFSTTGNVEGQWAIKNKVLYSLSEQELVDCDTTDEGCNGGLPENAYEAIKEIGGLESESAYPYEGHNDKCHFDKTKVKVTVNGSVELPTDEVALAKWLVQNGPISIGINANALQFYVGGVSHPFRFLCRPANLDHGMLIVGYGIHKYPLFHKDLPFWIIKNSWGENWGEQGYYRVYRGDGTCGLNRMATSAAVP